MDVYFSDIFSIDEGVVHAHGAFNVSLINDLPLFVDPFLLFNSNEDTYRRLHLDIIRYVSFLRDRTVESGSNGMDKGLVKAWFYFPEEKQTWLGYSLHGNSGRGLAEKFARALVTNLGTVFCGFGNETISKSSHLEKLSLIDGGIGRDMISDFTTNLIKRFLCGYTQEFALRHLGPSQRQLVSVKKVWFNYETRTWADQQFTLPYHDNDYVLLTPRNILTKDETWINRPELLHRMEHFASVVSNDQLRGQLSQYLLRELAKKKTEEERTAVKSTAILQFPEILDYYIKAKEDRGGEAESVSRQKVQATYDRYVEQVRQFVTNVLQPAGFYECGDTSQEQTAYRIQVLKRACEVGQATSLFCESGQPITNQNELALIMRLIWAAKFHGNPQGNERADTSDDVCFKLASNRRLAESVSKTLAKGHSGDIKTETIVVFVLSEADSERIAKGHKSGELPRSDRVVYIDVRTTTTQVASDLTVLKRFRIALSFPGEHRDFVRQVAERLAAACGRHRILYDEWYEAEFARVNLDTYLQNLYHKESELIVVFLCVDYEKKEWCGLEWRAIRDLIKQRRDDDVMPLRFDNTQVPGLFSTDGYIWIGARSPEKIAELVLQRSQLNSIEYS